MSSLNAFVNFPSAYTTQSIDIALTRSFNRLSLSPFSPDEEGEHLRTPLLAWADYDVLPHTLIHSHPSDILSSSYIYRKALIRKHFLLRALEEWTAKSRQRREIDPSLPPCALEGAVPNGWTLELQFADELDEILADDLYDLNATLSKNEDIAEQDRNWFILKPGMSDRGQGIRLFSTRREMEEIFQEFEDAADEEEEEEEEDNSRVATSQLRHFVIQEYLPHPLLLSPIEATSPGRKFHLRAYFCLSRAWTVLLSRTVLALFASLPYSKPMSECSLLPHLTNTCLQEDLPTFGEATMPTENVLLLTELVGKKVLTPDRPDHVLTAEDIENLFKRVGAVGAEAIRAAIECGSIHMQLLPNAFEVFGVDFLVTLPFATTTTNTGDFSPLVSILEFNASPDFHQSGPRLQKDITKMFEGIVEGVIRPFFKLYNDEEEEGVKEERWDGVWKQGAERHGWFCAGKGEIRQW